MFDGKTFIWSKDILTAIIVQTLLSRDVRIVYISENIIIVYFDSERCAIC